MVFVPALHIVVSFNTSLLSDTVLLIDEDKISLYFLINARKGEEAVSSDRSY